jgi:hypothetical protein
MHPPRRVAFARARGARCERVDMPLNVVLEVTQTVPSFEGDTATGDNKPAVLETEMTINVPLLVSTGDTIGVERSPRLVVASPRLTSWVKNSLTFCAERSDGA